MQFENIDGGLRPTTNVYRAKISFPGILHDFKTGKTISLPKNKMKIIKDLFDESKRFFLRKNSFLPLIKSVSGNSSMSFQRKKTKFPYISRLKQIIV